MDKSSGKFTITNNKGEELVCDVLFTFDDDKFKKSYIVFTDNSLDEIESLQAEIEKLKVDISNIKNVIEVYAELRERITVLENNVSSRKLIVFLP